MSNRRHLPRPLFPLYIQLDRQKAAQRSITFAEEFNPQSSVDTRSSAEKLAYPLATTVGSVELRFAADIRKPHPFSRNRAPFCDNSRASFSCAPNRVSSNI